MFERLRKVLRESFVGAIALGWVFAQGILHFAYVFSAPVASGVNRRAYHLEWQDRPTISTRFSLYDALPELVKAFSLLLVGYLVLRWLFYKPLPPETAELPPEKSA